MRKIWPRYKSPEQQVCYGQLSAESELTFLLITNCVNRIKSRRNSSWNRPVFYSARLVVNHHKRLSKWRRPIKFWRAVFTQKRWDRFYPPRLSHFTRQRPVSLLSTSFLRRSLGKQLQVTLQVYHHNSVSVFIQFICFGNHPAVEQTYQSCTEDVNTVERFCRV